MKYINALYPHLLPVDVPIWELFLSNCPYNFDRIDYDIRVGKGLDPGTSYAPNYRQMCLDLSRKRIDAIGYTATAIYLIEITKHAGMKALGQLTAYPTLFRLTYPTTLLIIPLLVAQDFTTDCQIVFDMHDIAYWTPEKIKTQNKPLQGTIESKGI